MADTTAHILWVDDEIELLKPYLIFLEEKGYRISSSPSGLDALDILKNEHIDLIFLDEQMPGMSGIDTLSEIKKINPNIPVVMITKSEAESIMEQAIGSNIADYLIKPVKPNQILLAVKKNLEKSQIVNDQTIQNYQQTFRNLQMKINSCRSLEEWKEIYKELVFWELSIEQLPTDTMDEILQQQKREANDAFYHFVKRNYYDMVNNRYDEPINISTNIFKNNLFPYIDEKKPKVLILVDNLRWDQWKTISGLIAPYYHIKQEELFLSILPTVTQYARNAMFSGLMPKEINKLFPDLWFDDEEEEQKNLFEKQLFEKQLKRHGKNPNFFYAKVFNTKHAERVNGQISNFLQYPISVIIFNFVDMLSHARTDNPMIRELANDEKAYRSITKSWVKNSPFLTLFKNLAEKDVDIFLTTDHGSIKVTNPVKVVGDRDTSTNLRYKQGKHLSYPPKDVFEILKPQEYNLPQPHLTSTYIFAKNNDFLAYPNNYNHYVKYYKDTFQHGGISLEEMLIPFIHLTAK